MNDLGIIDACGLSCPQPAMLARQAMQSSGTGRLEVLVDTETALQNITRLAEHMGWIAKTESRPDGVYKLVLTK